MPERDPTLGKNKKKPQNRGAGNVREAAFTLLHRLFQHPEEGTPLPVMLSRCAQENALDGRDAALLTELTCGVLRRAALLDYLLAAYLKKPSALSAQIRMLLRLGMYELLFVDGIPARATVSELVGLARRKFGQGLGGLVNGVLRSADREAATLRERMSAAPAWLTASIPGWMMEMWQEQYGAETAADFALNTLEQAAPCWRVNMAKEGADNLREAWLERGYQPVGRCGFSASGLDKARTSAKEEKAELEELEARGFLTRQGISSQLVVEHVADWLIRQENLVHAPLWDACCGRGGKSTALLEKGVNVALSSDPSSFRVEELRAAAVRLGLPEHRVLCAPEQEIDETFPLILLDVPCSGTGTLGRAPELRIRLSLERLAEAERLQGDILEDAWGKLQPGGALFYVTCALNRRENEGRIEQFLTLHGYDKGGDARLEEQRLFLPQLPGHDALFFAILRKN